MSAGNATSGVRFRVFMISALAVMTLGLFALPAIASAAAPVASDVFAGTNDVTPVDVNFNATDGGTPPVTYSIVTPPLGGTLGRGQPDASRLGDLHRQPDLRRYRQLHLPRRPTSTERPNTRDATVIVRPDTAIDAGPSGLTNDDTPTFEFSSPQAGTVFECSIDADAYAACTSPFTAATLSDGAHTFDVRARAGLGGPLDNSAARPASTSMQPPRPSASSRPERQDDPTKARAIEFTLSADEDLNAGTVDASDFDVTNGIDRQRHRRR